MPDSDLRIAPGRHRRLIGIVAMTPNRVIGHAGGMPWQLPEDLAFFKRTTTGHPIVMGRRTFEAIGRPLPNRSNIVLTRDRNWHHTDTLVIHRPDDLANLPAATGDVFIIGGAEIYSAFLGSIDELLITHVKEEHPGDTWFPEFTGRFRPAETVLEHPKFTVRRWLVS